MVIDRIGDYRRLYTFTEYLVQERIGDDWRTIRAFDSLSNNFASNESKRFLISKAKHKVN